MRLSLLAVTHTERALTEVMRFSAPTDSVLSRYFRTHHKIGSREREAITEGIYAVLRHRLFFANCAESGSGPAMRRLALLGLAEFAGIDALPALSEEEVAWLSRMQSIDRMQLSPRMRADMPEWIFERLIAQYGEAETLLLADSLNRPASLDIRINTVKARREEVVSGLDNLPTEWESMPYAPAGLRLKRKIALRDTNLFKCGAIEVQDEGSQLLAQIVGAKRGEMVADFCAGSGGKTLAMGAFMRNTGRLYAFDTSDKRLAKMKPRLARSGLSNVYSIHIAHERDTRIKRLAGKLDRVLVDAPCTGLGTIRRNPDMKWRQSPQTLCELVQRQCAILNAAASLVKPGGRLVYATCSFLSEENEDVVRAFLEKHLHFTLRSAKEVLAEQKIHMDMGDFLRLFPHRHQTDGFFAAVLERAE
ncbi:MAG: RsmB/NOP family class I SAM-dependent RNA methyltransferase [Burkholderiaceae bacterium]|jgi:16S rRNA (cytosine967-C5)-methyltransferase|nr:RsmB/NOP family class I SAM-dependent RNA methyltransferase [Burkholderiaceae bacterium]